MYTRIFFFFGYPRINHSFPQTQATSGQSLGGRNIYTTQFQHLVWQRPWPPGAHHQVKNGNLLTGSKEAKPKTLPPHQIILFYSTSRHSKEEMGAGGFEEVVKMRGSMNQTNIGQVSVQLLRGRLKLKGTWCSWCSATLKRVSKTSQIDR